MSLAQLRAALGGHGPSVVELGGVAPGTAAAAARAGGARVAVLGPTPSKRDLLAALGDALALPAWWGRNWDALEECLVDLAEGPTVVVWPGPGALPADERATAVDVWRSAARRHHRPLVLVLGG